MEITLEEWAADLGGSLPRRADSGKPGVGHQLGRSLRSYVGGTTKKNVKKPDDERSSGGK